MRKNKVDALAQGMGECRNTIAFFWVFCFVKLDNAEDVVYFYAAARFFAERRWRRVELKF